MADRDTIHRRALALIADNGHDVAKRLAQEFGLSRQTASAHLKSLLHQKQIEATGSTRARVYDLAALSLSQQTYVREGLQEDIVWREVFAPAVAHLPENVRDIWRYGVTEMVNNAIDHSGSEYVYVTIRCNSLYTDGLVWDEGEGIFLKIQRALGLYDPREAILELAKGKLTTDPAKHSGEGIFFTSRVFDRFIIFSGKLLFTHAQHEDDLLVDSSGNVTGTRVFMRLDNDSPRVISEVFDKFAAPDSYTFDKTIVPVRLEGFHLLMPRGRFLPRSGTGSVAFGPPLDLPADGDPAKLARIVEEAVDALERPPGG